MPQTGFPVDVVRRLFGILLPSGTAQGGVSAGAAAGAPARAAAPIELAMQVSSAFRYDFTPDDVDSLRIASHEVRHMESLGVAATGETPLCGG